ncbi:iron ABC transporter permease [Maridesulfovibrio sp.]|uniref:ABC transporter permease n=1 Tax=Maridesulfovibrio sp. TaxID=2795000 RepID=UPI002A18E19C|nr:iron ABC transporter permease [Maridesulfovibrio sp.]
MQAKNIFRFTGLAVLGWVLVGTILYPALSSLAVSLTRQGVFSTGWYREFLFSSSGMEVLGNSILLGLLTVLCCGLVGTALAFFVNFFRFPGRSVVDKLLLLPIMMPGIIIVFAFMQLYGESGLVTKSIEILFGLKSTPYEFNGLSGILFVHTYTQYVYFYLAVSISLKQMDWAVIESARSLGASRRRVFFSIIVPLIAPALITSSAVTFMTGIGSFTAPSIIGGSFKVLTTRILLSKANNYMELAAAQAMILTAVSLLFFIFFRWYERRKITNPTARSVPLRPVFIRSHFARTLVLALTWLTVILILLPFVVIIIFSFVDSGSLMVSIFPDRFTMDNYAAVFSRRRVLEPFVNSMTMSLAAAGVCACVALPSAWLLEKSRFRFRWALDILVMLPWAMPATAIAVNIINAAARPGVFTFNTVLVGTYVLLPVGYFVRSLPIAVKTVQLAFQDLNDSFLEASRSLGMSGVTTFRRVVLPLLYPGILAGFILVFVHSIGEYTVSAFLYTVGNKPVSIAMVNAVFEYDTGLAMAYGTLLILLTVILSMAIGRFRRA